MPKFFSENVAGAGYKQQLWGLHPVSIPAVSSLVVLHLDICGITPREGFPFEVTAVMEMGSRPAVCLLHARGLAWFGQSAPCFICYYGMRVTWQGLC